MPIRLLQHVQRLQHSYALACASGVLYFLGFCGYGLWYLAWFCLVPVLWALDNAKLRPQDALGIGWALGLVAHLGAYTWMIGLLRNFGELPWPLALLGYFLLCLAQSSLFGAWGVLTHLFTQRWRLPLLWAAPIAMVLCEWLWPALFPSYLANSQYRQTIFIQSLDLWGPLGLTFILSMASAVLYQTLAWIWRLRGRFPQKGWAVFSVLMVANAAYGWVTLANLQDTLAHVDRRLNVGLVQVNMGMTEKHEDPLEGANRHREQSIEVTKQGADIILWPESGFNFLLPTSMHQFKTDIFGDTQKPIIFGGLRAGEGDMSEAVYNTAFAIDAQGTLLGTYDKTFLLAFGEYLPFGGWFPKLYELIPQASHFAPGTHQHPITVDGIRYGILICYEDILPRFVRQSMVENPQVLVNLTNDAWFGQSREPLIHLALSVFRSVETRRYLLRSTNSGISAVVDPAGRIVAQTPLFARANLVEAFSPLDSTTLYTRIGDWLGWTCLLGMAFWRWRQTAK